jgi:hypothetical protein
MTIKKHVTIGKLLLVLLMLTIIAVVVFPTVSTHYILVNAADFGDKSLPSAQTPNPSFDIYDAFKLLLSLFGVIMVIVGWFITRLISKYDEKHEYENNDIKEVCRKIDEIHLAFTSLQAEHNLVMRNGGHVNVNPERS